MRIHVTGNAGAGKTTLARHLGETLGLPVFHLDKIVWGSNWRKSTPDYRALEIQKLLHNDRWIIDGVSEKVRQEADIVIVMAPPTYKCMYRCIKRCIQYGFRTRPELPANCPEISILFRAIKIVWRFPKHAGKQILLEAQQRSNYLVCNNAAQAEDKLESLYSHLVPSSVVAEH